MGDELKTGTVGFENGAPHFLDPGVELLKKDLSKLPGKLAAFADGYEQRLLIQDFIDGLLRRQLRLRRVLIAPGTRAPGHLSDPAITGI
ncbi:MAG TPA: hypothetical protein VGL17_02490 [Gemmatimonadaceae bacterium]